MMVPKMTALSKAIQPIQGKYIFLSRSRIPCHNQSNAVIKYAVHEKTETPAARRPTHIVKTCGIVITKLKIDALPSNRRINVSRTERRPDGIAGFGGIFPSQKSPAPEGLFLCERPELEELCKKDQKWKCHGQKGRGCPDF